MADLNCIDDLALVANTSAQVESLLNILDQVAKSIALNVNANKTEFMCFQKLWSDFHIEWQALPNRLGL